MKAKFKRTTILAVWNGVDKTEVPAWVLVGSGLAVSRIYQFAPNDNDKLIPVPKQWTITHVESGKQILSSSVGCIRKLRYARITCSILAPLFDWSLPEKELMEALPLKNIQSIIRAVIEYGEVWRVNLLQEMLRTKQKESNDETR